MNYTANCKMTTCEQKEINNTQYTKVTLNS